MSNAKDVQASTESLSDELLQNVSGGSLVSEISDIVGVTASSTSAVFGSVGASLTDANASLKASIDAGVSEVNNALMSTWKSITGPGGS